MAGGYKEILYAKKDATEQLRFIHGISIDPKGFTREVIEGVYVVTAPASMPNGRTDVSTGAVPIDGLKGEDRANAMMKSETKAKRRVTLSICGLGMLDETEVETIRQEAPPLIVESNPVTAAGARRLRLSRAHRCEENEGRPRLCRCVLSTGETVMAFGQMVKLLEGLAQDQVAVQLETEKTSKGFMHIIEARTTASLMRDAMTPTPAPKDEIPF